MTVTTTPPPTPRDVRGQAPAARDDRVTWCLTPDDTRVAGCHALHDTLDQRVADAVASVNDPEYPDVSIVDLGLLESLDVDGAVVTIGLIPTFLGCPALHMIADDVRAAVEAVAGIEHCEVSWLARPSWSTDRMSPHAARRLSAEYTVIVRGNRGELTCPVCGGGGVTEQSMAGPTRCRSIAWCPDCRNPVEVMRAGAATAEPPAVGVRIRRSPADHGGRQLEVVR